MTEAQAAAVTVDVPTDADDLDGYASQAGSMGAVDHHRRIADCATGRIVD